MPMQEQRVRVGEIELQIRDYPNMSDPIIFLHFSGANLMMWLPAVPYFQDHYRLILLDLLAVCAEISKFLSSIAT